LNSLCRSFQKYRYYCRGNRTQLCITICLMFSGYALITIRVKSTRYATDSHRIGVSHLRDKNNRTQRKTDGAQMDEIAVIHQRRVLHFSRNRRTSPEALFGSLGSHMCVLLIPRKKGEKRVRHSQTHSHVQKSPECDSTWGGGRV
jgi:hypothetical protein